MKKQIIGEDDLIGKKILKVEYTYSDMVIFFDDDTFVALAPMDENGEGMEVVMERELSDYDILHGEFREFVIEHGIVNHNELVELQEKERKTREWEERREYERLKEKFEKEN